MLWGPRQNCIFGGGGRHFYFLIFPSFIEYSQHITLCVILKCTTCHFDAVISCKIITTLVLATTSISYPSYHFFLVVRTFMIFSLSNTQVYDTVLLAIITTLYIRSPDLFILKLGICTLWQHVPLLLTPTPGNHHSTLCFSEFLLFRFHA